MELKRVRKWYFWGARGMQKLQSFFSISLRIIPFMRFDTITLAENVRPIIHLDDLNEIKGAWREFGFTQPRPTIVIIGGAGGMSDEDFGKVKEFFKNHLLPFAKQKGAVIIDGGTDSGVMAAVGYALKSLASKVPAVGVYARDVEGIAGMLEPSHTHFITCPGSNWGDESEYLAASATELSVGEPTVAVLINGGQITWNDARLNIQYGRSVLIAEGTGRAADAIATTQAGHDFDSKAIALIRTGKVHIGNFFKDPEGFIRKMDDLLSVG